MTELRLNCIVPGCRRTRGQRKGEGPIREGEEWCCGEHWQAVPKFLRRRLTRLRSRYTRRFGYNTFWVFPAGSPKRLAAVRLHHMRERAWKLCRKAAIERGLGIR